MTDMQISAESAWSAQQIATFFADFDAPLRLASTDALGFPRICSLWFRAEDTRLLCATQEEAWIARALGDDPRCGFELAPNTPPYFGVRGRGHARIEKEGGAEELGRLIDRYLGDRTSDLAKWLLSRTETEVVLAIDVDWITSWDYRPRMPDATVSG